MKTGVNRLKMNNKSIYGRNAREFENLKGSERSCSDFRETKTPQWVLERAKRHV